MSTIGWLSRMAPVEPWTEVYVDAVARQWVEWGHEVTLFCARTPGQSEKEDVDGVHVIRGGGRFGVYRQACRWHRAKGRGRFDVVLDVVNTRPFLTPTYISDTPIVALVFQVALEVWAYEVPRPAALVGRHWLEPRWLRGYASVPTLTISDSSRASLGSYGLRDVSIVPVGMELPLLDDPPSRETRPRSRSSADWPPTSDRIMRCAPFGKGGPVFRMARCG